MVRTRPRMKPRIHEWMTRESFTLAPPGTVRQDGVRAVQVFVKNLS
jgi:hypothetical protein